jgi:hypothetical protein
LAEDLEERIVVDRSSGPGSFSAIAPLTLESRFIFQSMVRAPQAILVAPFNKNKREESCTRSSTSEVSGN